MKSTTIPILCGIALAAMSAAGLSHWWSLGQFAYAIHQAPARVIPPPTPFLAPSSAQPKVLAQTSPTPDAAQKKFYEALIAKMDRLQSQNRDLSDQMAETNRDVMKLEFRVDTHSESFRPMPVSEDRLDSSDNAPGVLPPRAEPVFPPGG